MSTNPFDDSAAKNPYASPTGTPSNFSGGPLPLDKVAGPAIGLMIVGGIGVALCILGLALNLLGVGLGAAGVGENEAQMQFMAQGALGIVQALIGLAISGVAIYGGMQMKSLQNYGLAMTSAILVMIPCISPCCLIGLPIGIWAIVVLNDPVVKGSFR